MRKDIGRLASVILGMMILQVAGGTLGVLVPLQMGLASAPTLAIGLVVTAHSAGFLVGCVSAPEFIRIVGHIRAFAALAAALSVASLVFAATDSYVVWTVLRFATGLCFAGLFSVIESWIAAEAPADTRGHILSIYMVCNKAALMLGQASLTLSSNAGTGFFLIVCGCFSLSLIPVALTRVSAPARQEMRRLSIRYLYRLAPVAVVGCFGAGLANSAVLGLAPVFGLATGIAPAEVPFLIIAAQLGSLALQWPLGWLSDRLDRRLVIGFSATVSAMIAFATARLAGDDVWTLVIAVGVWGGFSLSVYSICIAHAVDLAEPRQTVPLVSGLLMCWAIGSSLGPPFATALMTVLGGAGLFYFAGLIGVMIGGFAVWRTSRRPPVPAEFKDEFVNLPASSPIVAELNPVAPRTAEAVEPKSPELAETLSAKD